MIEQQTFSRAWKRLCTRFGRTVDADEAADFHEYLSARMSTPEFLAAAQSLWATAKWFPRPADFVLVDASGEWRRVLEAVSRYSPPDAAWVKPWDALSERAQAACRQLGGLSAMRAIYERDVLRLKAAWETEYERLVGQEAIALPPGEQPRARPAAGAARRELPRGAGGLNRVSFAAPVPQAVHRG
jgi:hypothetical protein